MGNELLDIDSKAIGYRVRRERESLNLTREKFAEIVNLSALYVGQLERGERQMSLSTLVRMAKSLHVTTDYLIYGRDMNANEDYIKEKSQKYLKSKEKNHNNDSLYLLLSKCSKRELDLIERMIKLIIPYIK